MVDKRVLIVVPTLGRRLDYLRLALESIAAQSEPCDLVVVTPKDAPEARALAVEFGAAVVDDRGGLSAAINDGFQAARGCHVYANWLGDDDLLAPESIRTAVSALDARPDAVVAFGHCTYIDDEGRRLFESRVGALAPWLMTWGPDLVPQPGAMFRLDAVRKVGGLDETLRWAMDLDLLLKLRRVGAFVNTGTTLASFRWHEGSNTVSDRTANLIETEQVKRRYLPRAAVACAIAWEVPVRILTRFAVRQVQRRASKISSGT